MQCILCVLIEPNIYSLRCLIPAKLYQSSIGHFFKGFSTNNNMCLMVINVKKSYTSNAGPEKFIDSDACLCSRA